MSSAFPVKGNQDPLLDEEDVRVDLLLKDDVAAIWACKGTEAGGRDFGSAPEGEGGAVFEEGTGVIIVGSVFRLGLAS